MKGLYFGLIIILAFALLLMPLCALFGKAEEKTSTENFKVYITEKAEIKEIPSFEYALNVAINNLESGANVETIKAEVIAAYTLALYNKNTSNEKNFDFNDSLDGFLETEKLKEKLGDNYDTVYNRFYSAAKEVFGYKICYNNAPILALRHKASGGFTEDAKNILEGEYPYLASVESAGDLLWDGVLTTKTVGLEDMKKELKNQELTPTDTPAEYFKITKKTTAGNVLKLKVLNKEFSGEEIKNIFNLASTCFEISFKDNNFIFTVMGSGNMLGLSRVGAEYMAKEGHNYTQILSWYYPGCSLEK